MPTLKTVTLGCKVNQYESEFVRQGLAQLGYSDPRAGEPPDLCVVNTCTVTAEAEAQGRKLIRSLARKHPQTSIVVMGCAAARCPEQMAALPNVVEVLVDKSQLPQWLARKGLSDPPRGISRFAGRRRACVKIQDGCRLRCSYCIVPHVRPTLASRPAADVLDEIRRLVDCGHCEIVLTGIHLGHYGREGPDGRRAGLAALLAQIAQLPGDFRVRLSSIEASEVDRRLLRLMRDHPGRICAHLHLPLQSGSDPVLRRMRRPLPVGRFVERCRQIREQLDRPAITTDVIVGFPGETEADFQSTCRVVEELALAGLHVFRYSRREGTPAAALPGQVRDGLKNQRAAVLKQIGHRLRRRYRESLLGGPLSVIPESVLADRPGWLVGTSDRYVPVRLAGTPDLIGRLVQVVASRVEGDALVCRSSAAMSVDGRG